MSKTLQSEIKRLRRLKNLTQEVIADKLEIKRSTYAQKEKLGGFDQTELKDLARILGTSFSLLTSLEIGKASDDTVGVVQHSQQYLVQAAIRVESSTKVMLTLLAKLVANQEGKDFLQTLDEIKTQVNLESIQMLKELQ